MTEDRFDILHFLRSKADQRHWQPLTAIALLRDWSEHHEALSREEVELCLQHIESWVRRWVEPHLPHIK